MMSSSLFHLGDKVQLGVNWVSFIAMLRQSTLKNLELYEQYKQASLTHPRKQEHAEGWIIWQLLGSAQGSRDP